MDSVMIAPLCGLVLDVCLSPREIGIERWFAEITRQRIRRGTFHSVSELNRAISEYVRQNNRHLRLFIWTTTASTIMKKIKPCKEALDARH